MVLAPQLTVMPPQHLAHRVRAHQILHIFVQPAFQLISGNRFARPDNVDINPAIAQQAFDLEITADAVVMQARH